MKSSSTPVLLKAPPAAPAAAPIAAPNSRTKKISSMSWPLTRRGSRRLAGGGQVLIGDRDQATHAALRRGEADAAASCRSLAPRCLTRCIRERLEGTRTCESLGRARRERPGRSVPRHRRDGRRGHFRAARRGGSRRGGGGGGGGSCLPGGCRGGRGQRRLG